MTSTTGCALPGGVEVAQVDGVEDLAAGSAGSLGKFVES